MNGRNSGIIVMALAILLVACGSGPAQDSSLQDTRWVMVSLSGAPPLAGRPPSAEFAADQISGSAGCNTYFGTYEASDGEITIGDLAVTEMWCMEPEGLMDQEKAFLTALNTVARYRLAAERLELLDGAGTQVVVFGSEAAELPDPANTSPGTAGATVGRGSALMATIDAQGSFAPGSAVTVRFSLTNTSSEGLFVLKWFTPLEGLAGDIFRVQRDGVELPYQGKLVKRASPLPEDYVWLDAGESISAEVDLAEGYDLSAAGQYSLQFRSPRLSHIARTSGEQADSLDELEAIQIPSDAVTVTIGG